MSHVRTKYPFVYLFVLFLAGCASGSAIVTGNTRPPSDPTQVKLYLEPPANYEVIGIVKGSSDMGWTEQGSVDYAIEELKKQAAKLGANGVLLQSTGQKMTTGIGTVTNPSTGNNSFYTYDITAEQLQGLAIFVQP